MEQLKKLGKDKLIALCLVGAFIVVVLMYGVNAFYSDYTGEIATEFIVNHTESAKLTVNGFAVRDENMNVGGTNMSILYKNDDYVYVPVISDSENVSKNGVIAVAFRTQAEADAYTEEMLLREKLSSIKELERSEELSYTNILFLNSQISSDVASYLDSLSRSDLRSADEYIDNISKNITSKQIAIGEDLDYKTIIKDYETKIKELKSSYQIVKKITSPYAGYFVSYVDGFEQAISYSDVEDKKITQGEGGRLISLDSDKNDGAYGKIIAQHTWYYIFDTEVSLSSTLQVGYWVKVSFDEIGIKNLNMKVYDISDSDNGKVTVTLRCTSMNEELAKIRKEAASITLDEYNGFRISNEALTENDKGITGVYVVMGNIMKFSPVNIIYYGDGYVVASGEKMLRDENNKAEGYYHVLKLYDKIIVKGLNLEDGRIIE